MDGCLSSRFKSDAWIVVLIGLFEELKWIASNLVVPFRLAPVSDTGESSTGEDDGGVPLELMRTGKNPPIK